MFMQGAALRRAGALLSVPVLVLATAIGIRHATREHPATPGKPLPVIALIDLSGAPATIRPHAGTILYNVFATWCGPCAVETPALASAAPRLRARGITIVGIDQGDTIASVRSFAARYDLHYPILIDDGKRTNALLGARVIPETVLVRDGIVVQIFVGPLTPDMLNELVAVR
jgi:cytochrome c biogenesis protein CcmG, thiol:disulfide interchange protein DsbE